MPSCPMRLADTMKFRLCLAGANRCRLRQHLHKRIARRMHDARGVVERQRRYDSHLETRKRRFVARESVQKHTVLA